MSFKAYMPLKGIFVIVLMFFPILVYALEVGDTAPEFHIVTIDGKEISYDSDIKGKKPVYLIFWATW